MATRQRGRASLKGAHRHREQHRLYWRASYKAPGVIFPPCTSSFVAVLRGIEKMGPSRRQILSCVLNWRETKVHLSSFLFWDGDYGLWCCVHCAHLSHRQTDGGRKHPSVQGCVYNPHDNLRGPAAGHRHTVCETWVPAAMTQHVFKNKSLLSALGLHRAKQRVKGVQIVEIKQNICENQTAFTVFGLTATGKHGMSGLLRSSSQPLFCSLTAPPTLL